MKKNEYGQWEIPKNYIIEYEPTKNYNEINNKNYLPPYRSDFPSIYKGVEIEMHIVDHCNLNCNCCNHFSPLAEPWFIELEEFQNQLLNLKNNIPNIKNFLILGGEPALHPQLYEICMSARNILGSEVYIDVLSNGTIIKPIAKYKEDYLNNNIHFTFSSYYQSTKLNEIEKLKPLGRVYNTRILSKQTLVEPTGSLNGFNNFFNCVNHKLPCFTARDNKLYICPFSAHIHLYCEKFGENIKEQEGIDYLNILKINNDLNKIQTFCFTPKNICNYCNPIAQSVPFGPSYKDITEFEIPIQQVYFRDYNRYENIINQGKNGLINWATDPNQNPGRVDTIFESHNFATEVLRYGKGKIDIIIPYYNESIKQFEALRDNLLQQSIIQDCTIYLVSDNSNMDLGVMNIFMGYDRLHCIFLRNEKNQGPGATRQKGIDNSYNQYLLCLDADSAFINDKCLENIYNKINNTFDLVQWKAYDENNDSQICYCINRDIIQKYNLSFKPIYFGEDLEFYIQVISRIKENRLCDLANLNNIITKYNATKGNNITNIFADYDKLHFSFLTAPFIGFLDVYNKNEIINNNIFNDYIKVTLDRLIKLFDENHLYLTENTFLRSLIYYNLFKLKEINNNYILLPQFKSILNLFNININDNNIDIVKKYLYNYINDNYLQNKKLSTNAQFYLTLLEKDKIC